MTTTETQENPMKTLTVYQKALADLGHKFSQAVDGSWDVEANPDRSGEYGEITEADHALAQAAVEVAYAAGERRRSVLGVTFVGEAALCDNYGDGTAPGSWPVYDR
jgi:hypothetical protein